MLKWRRWKKYTPYSLKKNWRLKRKSGEQIFTDFVQSDGKIFKMSEKNNSSEHPLKGTVWEDAGPDRSSEVRRNAEISGWVKTVGVLILWFGFWGILSII
jgi:hypothetical protein